MRPGKNELGRRAAALLATCFVVVGGLTTCVALALLVLEKPLVPLLWLFGTVGGGSLLVWLLRDRKSEGRQARATNLSLLGWVLRGRDAMMPKSVVRVARARSQQVVEYGRNEPPSVEKVRELANDAKTWVPSDRRAGSSRNS